MSVEMTDPETELGRPAFPGAQGFLVLAKLRGMRNVQRETIKRLKTFVPNYCRARGLPPPPEPNQNSDTNGQDAVEKNEEKEENTESPETEIKIETEQAETETETPSASSPAQPECPIKFGPHEVMYENCCFIKSTVEDPSDFAHFAFSTMADDRDWPRPRFPLRVMPVQEICCLTPTTVETTLTPLLEKVFAGEESLRFSIIFHGKQHQDSADMPRQNVEALVRNIIWSINPNCVQCIKYQDYAILLEIIDPLLFVGVAKEFNQLGRYNTTTIHGGRDLKETMDDSEDEISDDPELDEASNIKRKLRIKKKRRHEIAEEEKLKQEKLDNSNQSAENKVDEKGDAKLEEGGENGEEDIDES